MLRGLVLTSIALAFGCSDPGSTVPAKKADGYVPLLSLRPVSVSLGKGATQVFQAEINYPQGVHYLRQPVGWRVVEPNGGTITGAGLYTAPTTPGIFHVEVIREDFPEITATATVTVK